MQISKTTNSPLVSVVIPVFNTEEFIEEAIESVLAQSYPSIEIIVVDDGSTDDSARVIRRYQQQDSRIQLIQQRNKGVASPEGKAVASLTESHRTAPPQTTRFNRNRYYAKMLIRGGTFIG